MEPAVCCKNVLSSAPVEDPVSPGVENTPVAVLNETPAGVAPDSEYVVVPLAPLTTGDNE
jgi:hypothetical protein